MDWFRCSAGPLGGPESQYRIHRDELKSQNPAPGGINCQVIMENGTEITETKHKHRDVPL